ncbi:MAG: phosphoadenylyl-sulfate reductase [Thermaerobacter sp.]|nr:phosphoadenylyl-sulfate reductase [Thermaerobacter sp.]
MQSQVTSWQEALQDASLGDVLTWAVAKWGDDLVLASSFGAEDMVLMHQAWVMRLPLAVFSLDTDLLFPETYALIERVRDRYHYDVALYRPQLPLAQQTQQFGGELWSREPDACCRLRKVEPLRRALAGRQAWMTGLRREQSPTRRELAVVQWDRTFHRVKINPLAHWSHQAVWDYLNAHDVPYNPLHDQGYPSIGCWPCTTSVKPGEDVRSGRWTGFDKQECGLHR